MQRSAFAFLAASLLTAAACHDSKEPASPSAVGAKAPAANAATEAASRDAKRRVAQRPRSKDPRVAQCAQALEKGDLERAQALLAELGDTEQPDTSLMRARARAAASDAIGAVREIEAARRAFPDQASVYATAAEIHAAAGRLESAENEIRMGLAVAGPTPELERARGVLMLCRERGAMAGLQHLIDALRADPGLPFCERALAQAHLLLGNAAMAQKDPATAIAHARAALVLAPTDQDTRMLLCDALAAKGELGEALKGYEALMAEGRDLRSTLALYYQRAATAALLVPDRALAVERYLRARELGLSDSDLGFGLQVLAETSSKAIESGIESYEAQDLAAARASFEQALRCCPNSVEGHNHLAVVLFKQGHFDGASEHWRKVLDLAAAGGETLPEPVHLNLARALHEQGQLAEVKELLEDYLAREPQGEWADATRKMLDRFAAEELARQASTQK